MLYKINEKKMGTYNKNFFKQLRKVGKLLEKVPKKSISNKKGVSNSFIKHKGRK